jgi:hypothetical protein
MEALQQPTGCTFAVSNLGNQPGAGAHGCVAEGEAQGIPKKLSAFSEAGGRQVSRANANALAAEGNAGMEYDAGGVIGIDGNPNPGTAGRGLGRNQRARAVV